MLSDAPKQLLWKDVFFVESLLGCVARDVFAPPGYFSSLPVNVLECLSDVGHFETCSKSQKKHDPRNTLDMLQL